MNIPDDASQSLSSVRPQHPIWTENLYPPIFGENSGFNQQIISHVDRNTLTERMSFSSAFIQSVSSENIVFHIDDEEILRFEPQGRVFVRGQQVDDNREIYAAFLHWGVKSGLMSRSVMDKWVMENNYKDLPVEPGKNRYEILTENET